MKKSEAIEILKQGLLKIPHLRQLAPSNQEFELWRDKILDVIDATLDAGDRNRFSRAVPMRLHWNEVAQARVQAEYVEDLNNYETALKSIIQKYEVVGFEDKAAATTEPAACKAFIAHGGESAARDKLESFLMALGVTPIIVEEQPSQGRSKDKNVEHYLKLCDCAIILATKGDIDGRTGEFIPRGNILIEIGRSQEILPDRMIYLLEEGAKFPTDIDEKVWERFTKESMDKAFTKIAKELRAFGLIRAIKPAG